MESVSDLSSSIDPLRQRTFRLLCVAMLLLLLAAGVWLGREALLRVAGDLWIISDPVTHADVVAVLGGGLEVRPFAAAELYKQGLAKRIVISKVAERPSKLDDLFPGIIPGHSELNRMVLIKLGVPETAIEMFGQANKSTRDEAVALREWANQRGISRIIIPTEAFEARRVRWIFHREFAGSSVGLEVTCFEAPPAGWWKTSEGLFTFQSEIRKYLFYRLNY